MDNMNPFSMRARTRFIRSSVLVFFCYLFSIPSTTYSQTMQVLYLDGKGAHIELPPSLFHQFSQSTIETWVKWEQIQNWSRVLDFGREGNALVVQSEKSSRTLNFALYDRNGNRHRIQAHNGIPVGQWFHIAVTNGPQGMGLYINGQLQGTEETTLGLEQVTGGSYYIGRSNWPDDEPFQGYLSEIRIWNKQRSQSEIQRTMERRLQGNEPNLVAYWRLDTAQNDMLYDAVKNLPAQIKQGARVVAVPPIARYLIPNEMEKDKQQRLASARKHTRKNDHLNAYRDYQAALDLGPGDRSTREAMIDALEKSRIKAVLLPFQTTEPSLATEMAYTTTLTLLNQNRPAYINWLTPATTQFMLYEQGVSPQAPTPDLISAAKTWHIRLLAQVTLQETNVATSRTRRNSQTAYRRPDVHATADSMQSVRYNIISQSATANARAKVEIIDTQTGRILDQQILASETSDHIEYADYSGDIYALWEKRGSHYRRLASSDSRFSARQKLKSDQELSNEVLTDLSQKIAQRIQSLVTLYQP